ncbi:MAG: hypothetical protein V3U50_05325 [Acidimicrobiia bacterium]
MRPLPASLLALSLIAAGCSDGGTSEPVPTTTITIDLRELGTYEVTRADGCDAEPGSPTDLESEPAEWLLFGDYERWFDSEGCPVRLDVIAHIHGSGHCDLEKAEFITLGVAITQLFDIYNDGRYIPTRYIWAPDGVIRGVASGEEIPRFAVPESAIDTRYRQGETELWVDPTDPTGIFLIRGEDVRVFQRNPTAGLCA